MELMILTVVVEVLDEVGLACEPSSELVGLHVGEGAFFNSDCLRVNHF